METIKLPNSDKIKVQSSLDFFLSITSVKEKSLAEVRKNLYNKFMAEYKEDNYPIVNLDDYRGKGERGTEEDIVEEVVEEKTSANNFLQALQKLKSQPPEENDEQEDEFAWDEDESDLDEDESDWDEEDVEESPELDEDESIAYGEEDEETEGYKVDAEGGEEVEDSKEYEVDTPDSPYVSHGVYLEDLLDGTAEINDYDENNGYDQDTEEDTEWNEDSEADIEDEESDTKEESIEWDEDEEDDSYVSSVEADEDWLAEDEEDDESLEDSEEIDNEVEEPIEEEEESLEDWISEDKSEAEIVNVEPVESGTGEVEYSDESWFLEEPTDSGEIVQQHVQKETSMEDDGKAADVPSNVRAFIKQHPGSEMLYVLKFYSKKDVEKALKLGRIYKKGGKLFI